MRRKVSTADPSSRNLSLELPQEGWDRLGHPTWGNSFLNQRTGISAVSLPSLHTPKPLRILLGISPSKPTPKSTAWAHLRPVLNPLLNSRLFISTEAKPAELLPARSTSQPHFWVFFPLFLPLFLSLSCPQLLLRGSGSINQESRVVWVSQSPRGFTNSVLLELEDGFSKPNKLLDLACAAAGRYFCSKKKIKRQ